MRFLVLLLFFVSGACGLVYEVIWVRELTLLLGISVYAVSTVLSAYMAGLAIGSFWFGRLAVRQDGPQALKTYAGLEVAIGFVGLTWPYLLGGLTPVFVALGRTAGEEFLPWIRVFLAFFALLVPTILMGGTLSVLSRFVARRRSRLGVDLGLLYGINTGGAVAGCALAGFFLIEHLGLTRASQAAGLVNLIIGALAWHLARRPQLEAEAGSEAAAGTTRPARPPETSFALRTVVILAFAGSGLLAMASEVVWARCLAFFLHNSTYAFSAMLTVYLAGIALGSVIVRGHADRSSSPVAAFGLLEIGIGFAMVLSLFLFTRLDGFLERYVTLMAPADLQDAASGRLPLPSFSTAAGGLFLQAVLILLPPTFLMGATFPVVARIATVSLKRVSESVGVLYAGNTLGGIAGSLLGGFVMLPLLGIRNSFLVLIFGYVALGALLLAVAPASRGGWIVGHSSRRLAATVLAVVVAVSMPFTLLRSGVIRSTFERHLGEVLYYSDGATDTVMVSERKGLQTRLLTFADGRGTSGIASRIQDRFYGHLPMVLHENPRSILSICFGVGNTLAAIALHPEVEHIDCVELSEGVLGAAPFFEPTNNNVLEDERINIHIEDGRNYLLRTDEKYDLIRLDPPEIHTASVVNLYTVEFYELCKQHLAEGGMFCQWMNVNMMPLHEQKMLLRSFADVFEHPSVWFGKSHMYLVLIATPEPLRIDLEQMRDCMRNPVIYADLNSINVYREWDFLMNFFLDAEGLREYVADVDPVVDDRTVVDFTTPRSVDANYGLCNAFSGLKFAASLKQGPLATNGYYAAKWLAMTDAWQSPIPHLVELEDPEDWRVICEETEARRVKWRDSLRARMKELKDKKQLIPNF